MAEQRFSYRYPRPSLVRDSFFSLSGSWALAFSEKDTPPSDYPLSIEVPFPPESSLSGVCEDAKGRPWTAYLHYKRTFTLPVGFHRERTLLHFGAVDQIAGVTLNGTPLGSHEGGYLPFSFDVSALLKEENTLLVSVRDTLDTDLPYGKQTKRRGGMWYTPVSGIWQDVWLESFGKEGIYSLEVESDTDSVRIRVKSDAPCLTLTYTDGEEEVTLPFRNEIELRPKSKQLWSPEHPHLYPFTLRSADDEAHSYFALRTLTAERVGGKTRFFLNGRPYFLHGVLDQGYFPDGIFTPSSPEEYEKDILRAKALGFNLLRKHIKIEPGIFYALCDRLGMLVCQDAVNNGRYSFLRDTALPTVGLKRLPLLFSRKSRRAREIFRVHTEQTLSLLSFYPSVCLFTVFNEGWGQSDTEVLYFHLKSRFPSMLFDTASGWFRTDATDMRSDHVYFKPVRARYGKVKKPVFLSEFGGYSLPVTGHVFIEGRNYGYTVCKSAEELLARITSLYEEQVIPAIRAGLGGAVYTQLTDIEDETNGFYTYDRTVCKIDTEQFAALREKIDTALSLAVKEDIEHDV